MKTCPNCKTPLDDSVRFCLHCMTSLNEKEQLPPPVTKRRCRLWMILSVGLVMVGALIAFAFIGGCRLRTSTEPTEITSSNPVEEEFLTISCVVDNVTYSFRPVTSEDHPTAIRLDNYFVLIRVEGTPGDGIYRVPSFVGEDRNALVTAVGDGAFFGTDAGEVDLGYNVRYVWGDAFAGCPLKDLYLHEDVLIRETTLSHCTEEFTIHCPGYLENTEGILWSELAQSYGFRWKEEPI